MNNIWTEHVSHLINSLFSDLLEITYHCAVFCKNYGGREEFEDLSEDRFSNNPEYSTNDPIIIKKEL